jgi:tetratricopeptide (TPR) repeat protein
MAHFLQVCASGFALARGLVELGSYEEALEIALQSTEAAPTLTFSILPIVNFVALGLVYQALLLPEQAREAHLEALQTSAMLPSPRYIALCATLLCADCVLADDWEAASTYARQALETRDPHVVVFPEVPLWPETEALVRQGLSEPAAEALRAFEERFGSRRRCRIPYLRAQAVLVQSWGKSDQAIACLQEAIAGAKEIGLLGELWQAEVALGRVHLAREEHEQATTAFARAAAIVQKLAGEMHNDALRSHFLESAQVQPLLMYTKK